MSRHIQIILLLFWKFLISLVCVPSFESINSRSLSRKKYDGDNFTPSPRKRLWGQNKSVGIGLTELTKPSDTVNYEPYFKHCILQTVLVVFTYLFIYLFIYIFIYLHV